MEKVTLTRVYRGTQTIKKGTPDEKDVEKCNIQTQEYGDKWISNFSNAGNASWKEGDVVEVEITQNGEYYNYKNESPKKGGFSAKHLQMIEEIHAKICGETN